VYLNTLFNQSCLDKVLAEEGLTEEGLQTRPYQDLIKTLSVGQAFFGQALTHIRNRLKKKCDYTVFYASKSK
jgi:hypothetical protein